jgi:polyphosphate kinase 2 (PPK2 family)
MSVYDRTWYGRVLVERVEGYASEEEWRRAYGEIAEFERMLVAEGTVLVKVWLHISRRWSTAPGARMLPGTWSAPSRSATPGWR